MRISPQTGRLMCEYINENREKYRIEGAIHKALCELNLSEDDYSFEAAKKYYYRHNAKYPHQPKITQSVYTDLDVSNYVDEFTLMNKPYFKIYGGGINKVLVKRLRVWAMSESGIAVDEIMQRCDAPQRTVYSDIIYFRAWMKARPNHQKPKQFW